MTDSIFGLNGPYVHLSAEIARQNMLNQSIQTGLCCESKRSLCFALSSWSAILLWHMSLKYAWLLGLKPISIRFFCTFNSCLTREQK